MAADRELATIAKAQKRKTFQGAPRSLRKDSARTPTSALLTAILALYKIKSSPWLWRNLCTMQNLSRDEFLEILGLTGGSFDQLQHAGHVALAFGTPVPATPGRYLDLDLVAMAVNLGLTPSLGRETSTAIVGGYFHQWASVVGHAEADPRRDFFMAVGGVGWDVSKKSPKLLLVTNGTVDEIAEDFRSTPAVVGFFTVNISDIIRRLRARAHAAGIDLSRPFFFPPNDPRFNEILTRVRRERDARIARLRRDKKKFAAVKARGRRRDIVAAPRVKDITYQLATPEMP